MAYQVSSVVRYPSCSSLAGGSGGAIFLPLALPVVVDPSITSVNVELCPVASPNS